MRNKFKKVAILILLPVVIFCSSWGFLVHKTVNQLAIYELPKSIRPFFSKNMKYIVDNAVRPDQRRNTDSTEAPKHFIDLEMYGDSAAWKMPMRWEDAVKIYSKDTLYKYGYVPYHVIRMLELLTVAFRARNKDSIVFYAADLGHYIGDANVPLHTSVNYDGQMSNQKGLHALWESTIPEIELDQYSLKSRRKANYLEHPDQAIWNAIRKAHQLLDDVFKEEKEASIGLPDSAKFKTETRRGREVKTFSNEFAKAYSERLGGEVLSQLMNSANLIADFWYTAWVNAGKPDLSGILPAPFEKVDKKELKKEEKAFHHGDLIEKKMLIGRMQPTSG